MRTRFLLPLLALALACTATAQPTWRFHLAFEDGSGARDTIWMIYDTSATVGSDFQPQVDYALGEGDAQLDYTQFNVFTWNWDGDSTKIHAYPYTEFPNFDGTIIDAINWTPPMTITWDTSLFHAPYLPYDQGSINMAYMDGSYFFFHSNDGSGWGYNMLITDNVVVDEESQFLFPFSVYFSGDSITIGIGKNALERWNPCPNPTRNFIHLPGTDPQASITLFDQMGRPVPFGTQSTTGRELVLDVSSLPPGMYSIKVSSPPKAPRHASFQKMD